jgi:hypothetical protein
MKTEITVAGMTEQQILQTAVRIRKGRIGQNGSDHGIQCEIAERGEAVLLPGVGMFGEAAQGRRNMAIGQTEKRCDSTGICVL